MIMKVSESLFSVNTEILQVSSSDYLEFIDITDEVENAITKSRISNGMVVVFSKHTTSAIVIQENEPLLLEDFKVVIENVAPASGNYLHNNFEIRTVHMHDDEVPNGHSHCQHLYLGTSETVPIISGKMPLGQWQRIFMVELDGDKASQVDFREVVVQILGQS
ncbi:MAG: secondary thiamine-phosphate synthase enzyme [Chloroflexi bacterium]|nr:secondary thiamine-phosphate synthase enzyme [Chloroflexota bacterium]